MRIVISGDGDIAHQLVRALHRRHDVVVIEDDADEAERFDRLDLQLMHGNATNPETLREAGVERADAFIACGVSDEANIIAAMTAKRMGAARATCFVSSEAYVQSFAGLSDSDGSMVIDRIVWPQYMLAEEIARIVLVPRAVDVEVFAGGRIWLMEFKLEADSGLIGALPQLGLPRGVLAVAVRKDEDFFVPSGKTELMVGDRVAFMGSRRALRELEEQFIRPKDKTPPKEREVVIVGGGTVGLTLAKRLEGEPGLRVKLIETQKPRAEEIAAALRKTLVLRGDGTDLELLESEQVGRAHVLVSVTSNDEKNLLCSLLASQMGVPKIITRGAVRAGRHRRAAEPDGHRDQRSSELAAGDRPPAPRHCGEWQGGGRRDRRAGRFRLHGGQRPATGGGYDYRRDHARRSHDRSPR